MPSEIPMLGELLDRFEKGEIVEEGKIYPCYFTEHHQKNKDVCWTHDNQFAPMVELNKKGRLKMAELFLKGIR